MGSCASVRLLVLVCLHSVVLHVPPAGTGVDDVLRCKEHSGNHENVERPVLEGSVVEKSDWDRGERQACLVVRTTRDRAAANRGNPDCHAEQEQEHDQVAQAAGRKEARVAVVCVSDHMLVVLPVEVRQVHPRRNHDGDRENQDVDNDVCADQDPRHGGGDVDRPEPRERPQDKHRELRDEHNQHQCLHDHVQRLNVLLLLVHVMWLVRRIVRAILYRIVLIRMSGTVHLPIFRALG